MYRKGRKAEIVSFVITSVVVFVTLYFGLLQRMGARSFAVAVLFSIISGLWTALIVALKRFLDRKIGGLFSHRTDSARFIDAVLDLALSETVLDRIKEFDQEFEKAEKLFDACVAANIKNRHIREAFDHFNIPYEERWFTTRKVLVKIR